MGASDGGVPVPEHSVPKRCPGVPLTHLLRSGTSRRARAALGMSGRVGPGGFGRAGPGGAGGGARAGNGGPGLSAVFQVCGAAPAAPARGGRPGGAGGSAEHRPAGTPGIAGTHGTRGQLEQPGHENNRDSRGRSRCGAVESPIFPALSFPAAVPSTQQSRWAGEGLPGVPGPTGGTLSMSPTAHP